MNYSIPEIKERVSLLDLVRRDGHEPRRMGAGWWIPCPFHDEKTPSCKVEETRFHCFGCAAHGDIFDYWERSRGLSRRDTIPQLASIAGVGPDIPGLAPVISRPAPRPAPGETVQPFDADQRAAWLAAVDTLRTRPKEIARIAVWRGIGADVIEWALDRGIMGLVKWSGIWREAFLVERPAAPSGPMEPVSVHIRLAPETRGNPHRKASWRFDPPRCGSWPLVFGDLGTARHIFIVEGQWDALALIHIMGWHRAWPATTALAAMRGASSFRKLLSHYSIHEKSTAFCIADADNAGASWFAPDGLVHQLSARVARIHAFWPGRRGADLNDLVKEGFDRAALLAILTPKLPNPRHRVPNAPTFSAWCRQRIAAPDPIGRAARAFLADSTRPRGRLRATAWLRHWRKLKLPDDLVADLATAWDTYKAECHTPA